ncbi:hypothetical protein BD821_103180 [Clostridium algidicarnis DSM 15099]|uniref:Uncharacterized protein n=1 Tax=Clostridium algidicarnis DSM 15099 TaxID=1121295 RepID=A0A2S6FZJ6_9CLOT|nr:hypothetical protein BD821_103180 [Clostridium algidicarnis DSM 15099]
MRVPGNFLDPGDSLGEQSDPLAKEYKIHTAPIPYSGAAVNLGRKVIQKLFGLNGFRSFNYN